jgi:hypothetical protein
MTDARIRREKETKSHHYIEGNWRGLFQLWYVLMWAVLLSWMAGDENLIWSHLRNRRTLISYYGTLCRDECTPIMTVYCTSSGFYCRISHPIRVGWQPAIPEILSAFKTVSCVEALRCHAGHGLKQVTRGNMLCKGIFLDRLCGLVVRVSGYRSGGPRFDSCPYKVF